MIKKARLSIQSVGFKRYLLVFLLFWTLIVLLLFYWSCVQISRDMIELGRVQALNTFQKDVVMCHWAAEHGGVYVPVTDQTPNPYLSDIKERDITTPSGKQLTLMNPAYMTRQLHQLGLEEYGHQGHITSLNPIRPENAADAWEKKALESFQRGKTEQCDIASIEGRKYLRLMRPLFVKKSCLLCHASQGYREGDLRGGISVSVPMKPLYALAFNEKVVMGKGFLLIWLFGVCGIVFGVRKVRTLAEQSVEVRSHVLESEERFRGMFEHMSSGAFIYKALDDGSDFLIMNLNSAAEKSEKIKKEHVIGKRLTDVFPNVEAFGLLQVLRDVLHSGEPMEMPASFYKDERVEGWRKNFVYRISSGEVVAIYDDLTDIRKSEEQRNLMLHHLMEREKELRCAYGVAELIHSSGTLEQLFEDVAELIPSGWHYPDKICTRICFEGKEYTSKGYRQTEWRQSAEVVVFGKTSGAIDVCYIEKPSSKCDRMKKGEFFVQEEMELLKDIARLLGEAAEHYMAKEKLEEYGKHLEETVDERTALLAARIEESEKLNSAMINIMDDLQVSNLELEASGRRLAVLNKELDSFSYSVSHDLRAPLRHVHGFASLLMRREENNLSSESLRYLNKIIESACRMDQLVNDLLCFSRVSRTETAFQPVDSNEIIEKIREDFIDSIEGRSIKWKVMDLPAVEGDPSMIQVVWENLIGNAVKYTARCEEACVEIGTINEDHYAASAEVAFFIRDNGVGFDQQYADKLYGVFQRLHNYDDFEGTGIGLATVKRIVERHGGRVWAEGAVGRGATFYFTLKAAERDM